MARNTKKDNQDTINNQDITLMLRFEDLTITKDAEGTIIIDKAKGGISDSTCAITAVGPQKFWHLVDESQNEIESGSQLGNRSFYFEGKLVPGTYTLKTGLPIKDFSKRRISGRGYSITFRIC